MSELDNVRAQLTAKNAEVDKYVMEMANATTPEAQKSAQTAMQAATVQVHELERQVGQVAAKAKADAEAAAAAQVAAQAADAQAAASAPASGTLTVGGTAYVQQAGGMNLRCHSAAGLNSEVIGAFEPGTALTLLAGPADADGHHWWQVRAADGREGWVAGEELVLNAD